jgi:hypothetical protein
MIKLRKRWALSKRARSVLPAAAFLACATLTAAGGDPVTALWLVPAGLALEAGRQHYDASRGNAASIELTDKAQLADNPPADARGEHC